MNIFDKWKDSGWFPYTVAACAGVLFYFILQHINLVGNLIFGIWNVLTPVILSIVLAYLMDPMVLFFENNVCSRFIKPWHASRRRKLGVVCTVVTLLLIIVLFVLALVPQVVTSVLNFIENFSGSVISLENQIREITSQIGASGLDLSRIESTLVTALESLSGLLSNGTLLASSQKFGSGISTFVVGFILAIYLLLEKKNLMHIIDSFFRRIMDNNIYLEFSQFFGRCHHILTRYLGCTILEGFVVGMVNGIFMAIMHMPYVAVVSVIVGVTNLAPTFGPIVGCVLGMFILLLVKPIYCLWFLIFTLILQTIDGYVIKPKLFGNSLGVSPLLILISIILGGQLFGILGILVAIPFSAIAEYAVTEYLFPMTRDKGAEEAEEERAAKYMNAYVDSQSEEEDARRTHLPRKSGSKQRTKLPGSESSGRKRKNTEEKVRKDVPAPESKSTSPDDADQREMKMFDMAAPKKSAPKEVPIPEQTDGTDDFETISVNRP